MTDCPKCFLPKDEGAWQCDGCGYEFSQDVGAVRARLERQLRTSVVALWWTLIVAVGIVGGLVYLATIGYIYISIPLLLAVFGSIGHALHRRSAMREHLQTFERRHAEVPKATLFKDSMGH